MRLFWHRRDLRITDNVGLAAAADAGPVLPVFVLDQSVLDQAGPPRVAFLLEALEALQGTYRDRESDLLVVRGDPAAALPRLATEYGADTVVWNEDYSGLARERDASVEKELEEAGLDAETYTDAVLQEPGSIRTNAGDPYQVFSYFWKKWRDRPVDGVAPTPTTNDLVPNDADPVPTLADFDVEEPEATIPSAGSAAAGERLEGFCETEIFQYEDRRDTPAAEATSGLSPHLKFGTIGIRNVYEATEDALDRASGEGERESVREFQSQLAWREFYIQVLFFNPEVVTTNFKSYSNPIDWREDPEALQAWRDGRTGYPIVDAGMRQLRAEALMHNRVRMIVASFLTKDLLIDWRKGYEWFREKLVDHDTANDTGGWQWAASTGTDAQPYFRIFNPMTQGERYDPDATYIKRYVPELRDATAEQIHNWDDHSSSEREDIAPAYPSPIVDHADRREAALTMFERARGEE